MYTKLQNVYSNVRLLLYSTSNEFSIFFLNVYAYIFIYEVQWYKLFLLFVLWNTWYPLLCLQFFAELKYKQTHSFHSWYFQRSCATEFCHLNEYLVWYLNLLYARKIFSTAEELLWNYCILILIYLVFLNISAVALTETCKISMMFLCCHAI